MKKEVVLAIIIGFGIGLVITFGIYRARTAIQNSPQQESQGSESPNDTSPKESSDLSLIITSPTNDALVDTEFIPLEGQAPPESIITIIAQLGQQIVTADKSGKFSTEVELAGGLNQIKISAFTQEGKKTETTITVVYSTADI